eukprot:GEMP01085992.1.p1 GENE.GEMP01085992.1~~GEMP01085992.1.p1  ORF type:complete len:130 (+),score=28.25 GEMP01085992.1:368-757(+)
MGDAAVYADHGEPTWSQTADTVSVSARATVAPKVTLTATSGTVAVGNDVILDARWAQPINVEESTWSFLDGVATLDLVKKTPSEWNMCVEGGLALPAKNNSIQATKLDAKIGEQTVSRGNYTGKSSFAW